MEPRMLGAVYRGITIIATFALLLLLVGCGGGGGGESGADYRASGIVKLPTGSALSMSDLKVMSCLTEATPSSDGTFSVGEPDGGPALVVVRDKDGHAVLMGFVDGSSATVAEIDRPCGSGIPQTGLSGRRICCRVAAGSVLGRPRMRRCP